MSKEFANPTPPPEKEPKIIDPKKLTSAFSELIRTGVAGDLNTFNQILEALEQEKFTSLDNFIVALKNEFGNKEWINQNWPEKTIGIIQETIDDIKELPEELIDLVQESK